MWKCAPHLRMSYEFFLIVVVRSHYGNIGENYFALLLLNNIIKYYTVLA